MTVNHSNQNGSFLPHDGWFLHPPPPAFHPCRRRRRLRRRRRSIRHPPGPQSKFHIFICVFKDISHEYDRINMIERKRERKRGKEGRWEGGKQGGGVKVGKDGNRRASICHRSHRSEFQHNSREEFVGNFPNGSWRILLRRRRRGRRGPLSHFPADFPH